MTKKTFEVRVKLPNGAVETMTVQAASQSNAKSIIESQYGVGSIAYGPIHKL